MFTIQQDASTDVANLSQLMVFARYMNGPVIEEFLFCKPLETTIKVSPICQWMNAINQCLLFHTQVRWLSKSNTLARTFELKEEVGSFLKMK